MTWDEHLAELQRIRDACEQNQQRVPRIIRGLVLSYLAALETDRWCKGDNPYGFLWSTISYYTDLEPNPAECNAQGYPTTVREAGKRLRAYEPTSWQTGRLLGYADWIQVHGWQAVDPRVAEELRSEYLHAGIDPEAIDFLEKPG